MLSFSDFAKLIERNIGKERNKADFVLMLFDNITDDGFDSSAFDVRESTLKSYYYGNTTIKNIASSIVGQLDLYKFSSFLEGRVSEDSAQSFADEVSGILDEDVTLNNVCFKCAEMFQEIIRTAAESTSNKKNISQSGELTVFPIEDSLRNALFLEAKGVCHYKGCGKSLTRKVGDKTIPIFDIVRINSEQGDEPGNLIALCKDCSLIHQNRTDDDSMEFLMQVKASMMKEYLSGSTAAEMPVDESIIRVLNKICELPVEHKGVELNYEPSTVEKKIADDIMLKIKVSSYVSAYFMTVKDEFRKLDAEKKIRYEAFAQTVKATFLRLDDGQTSKTTIFNALVEWLRNATNEQRESCEIVISYFVQNCEVFNAISE